MGVDTSRLGITEQGDLMPFRINPSDEQESIDKHFYRVIKNHVINNYPHALNYKFRIEGPLVHLTDKLAKEDNRWINKKERGKNIHVFHSLTLLINYEELINNSEYPYNRQGIIPSYKRSVLELILPIYAFEKYETPFVEICPFQEIKPNGNTTTIDTWAKNPEQWTKKQLQNKELFLELQDQPHYDKLIKKYL